MRCEFDHTKTFFRTPEKERIHFENTILKRWNLYIVGLTFRDPLSFISVIIKICKIPVYSTYIMLYKKTNYPIVVRKN